MANEHNFSHLWFEELKKKNLIKKFKIILCRDFSSTFRNMNSLEKITATKFLLIIYFLIYFLELKKSRKRLEPHTGTLDTSVGEVYLGFKKRV